MTASATVGRAAGAETLVPVLKGKRTADTIIEANERYPMTTIDLQQQWLVVSIAPGWRYPDTATPVMPLRPICLAATESEQPLLKRWFNHIVRRVIVGPDKPPPSPAEPAGDAHTPQPPFLYTKHRFTEAFTALQGHQLTGELSFAHATNVLLEDLPPAWTESEKRSFLRLSLQEAAKDTPAFDMSDVVYTPSPDTPQVPDFQHVFLVNADFHHAILPNADFTGAYLKRASFRYAQLPYASFQDAVLMQSDMDGAVLDGANFLHADLRRVYSLDRASLEQALYNEQTTFPGGFNPYFKGMLDVTDRSV